MRSRPPGPAAFLIRGPAAASRMPTTPRRSALLLVGLLTLALAACGAPAPPTVPPTAPLPTAAPPTATAPPLPTATPRPPTATPTVTPVPGTPTPDPAVLAVHATLTALVGAAAATATARVAPTATPTPRPPPPPVPAAALGTYRIILTARQEGYRVYQAPGTLVLRAALPAGDHSAELEISVGVRAGHEHADLSPGSTVGALVLATSAAVLPAGFDQSAPYAVGVRYDPTTKYLAITADPAHGIPGGWSTGPNNPTKAARPIEGGTLELDLGTPGYLSGQMDLRSTAAGHPVTYSGGIQATQVSGGG